MAAAQHLSEDATELACLIAQGSLPKELHNTAWEKLHSVIERIAERVASQCRCQEVRDEAVSYIFDRVDPRSGHTKAKYDPSKCRKFENWCETVLFRWVLDFKNGKPPSPFSPSTEEDGSTIEDLIPEPTPSDWFSLHEQRRAELRAFLDEMRERWPLKKRKYYSVLLFQPRWVMGAVVRKIPEWTESVSVAVEHCLAWTIEESESRWESDWPTWGEIWQTANTLFDSPDVPLTTRELCRVFGSLLPVPVNPGTWDQWVKRAKNVARGLCTAEQWNEYLAHFFPDRKSTPKDRPQ